MEFFDKIYVISLAHREDRRKHIQQEMKRFSVPFIFYDAVYGKEEPNNKAWYALSKGIISAKGMSKMSHAEIGCLLSHYMVWTEILLHMKEDKWYLIMEDDCTFHPDVTNDYLRDALQNVPSDAKMLKFTHLNIYGRSVQAHNEHWYKLPENSYSMMCYALHSSVIKSFVSFTYNTPTDHLIVPHAYVIGWKNFVFDPTFVMHYYETSDGKKIPNYYHGVCYSSYDKQSDIQPVFLDVVPIQ